MKGPRIFFKRSSIRCLMIMFYPTVDVVIPDGILIHYQQVEWTEVSYWLRLHFLHHNHTEYKRNFEGSSRPRQFIVTILNMDWRINHTTCIAVWHIMQKGRVRGRDTHARGIFTWCHLLTWNEENTPMGKNLSSSQTVSFADTVIKKQHYNRRKSRRRC